MEVPGQSCRDSLWQCCDQNPPVQSGTCSQHPQVPLAQSAHGLVPQLSRWMQGGLTTSMSCPPACWKAGDPDELGEWRSGMLSQASRVIALDNTCCYVLTGVNLWRNITSKSASVSRGYSEERASMLLQIDFFFFCSKEAFILTALQRGLQSPFKCLFAFSFTLHCSWHDQGKQLALNAH